MKLKLLFFFLMASVVGWGQVTIFSENMGTATATTTIASNIFQNNLPITFSGTADIRATSNSVGYTGASGGANVMINDTNEYFTISGINTLSYTNISLLFGQRKGSNAANNELLVEVSSNGNDWNQLNYSRPTGSGTANWRLIEPSGTIPSVANLFIRFTGTDKTEWRIDDVKLIGTAPTCTSPTTQATSLSSSNITQTSATVEWTRGNGDNVLVVARQGSAVNADPANGTSYTADANFGTGSQIEPGNFVVYNGTGTSVNLTGLTAGTIYHFAIYEYNTTDTCYNLVELTGNLTTLASPSITLTPNTTLNLGIAICEGSSATGSYVVSGSNLTEDIELTPSAEIEISINGTTWFNSSSNPKLVLTPTSGTLNNTTIQVRSVASLPSGSFTSTITHTSSGATPVTKNVSGTIIAPQTPTVSISSNPSSICEGESLNFSATPTNTGGGTVSYQWKRNGANVGTNSANYTLTTPTNGDLINCEITITSGCVTTTTASSSTITVNVNPKPTAPSAPTLTQNCNETIASAVTSVDGVVYWQTTATGTMETLAASNPRIFTTAGTYYLRTKSTNGCWSDATNVTITISQLAFNTNASNVTTSVGSNATFSVVAVGATNYQWEKLPSGSATWEPVSGANSSSYTINSVTLDMNGDKFRVRIFGTSPCGELLSNEGLLTVSEIVYANGDVRPLSPYVDFSWSGTSPYYWEEFINGEWVNRASSPQSSKPSGKIYINKEGITGGGNMSNTYNDIIILNAGELSLNNNNSGTLINFLNPSKKIEIQNGGKLILNGQIQLPSTSKLIVLSGGELVLNSNSINNYHTFWGGQEVFENGSFVIIKDWDWSASTTNKPLFRGSGNQISVNSNNYYFGNLIIDTEVESDWTLIAGSGYVNLRLTENNLEIKNTSTSNYISGTSNINSGFIINKDLIISDGIFNFSTGFTSSTVGTNNYVINGNLIVNSNDNLNLYFNDGGGVNSYGNINIKGDIRIINNINFSNDGNKKLILNSGSKEEPRIIDIASNVQNIKIEITDGYRVLSRNLNLSGTSELTIFGTNSDLFGTFDASTFTLSGANNNPLTVNNYGLFKTANPSGFSGASSTSVGDQIVTTLSPYSTVEYYANTPQIVTNQSFGTAPNQFNYQNLLITGSGVKTTAHGDVIVNGMTSIKSADAVLRVPRPGNIPDATPIPVDTTPNVFYALGGIDNTNGTTGKFVLSSDANLIQHNDSRNNADNSKASIVVERYVHDMDANNPVTTTVLWDYVYWSSPIKNHALRPFSPGTQTNRFYEYRESNNLFYNAPENDFYDAKGYAIRAEGNLGFTYNKTYEFTGEPNNANSYVSPILKMENNGYNLVGNPYPSNIDLDALFSTNSSNIYSVAYFWTNNTPTYYQSGASYVSNSYAIYNGTGGVPATTKATEGTTDYNVTATPNGYAKVGQGFIVKAKTHNAAELTFNTNMRAADNDMFFHRQVKNRFWINLSSPSQIVNTILVGYIPGATNEFEQDFDTNLMTVGSDAIYSILGTRKLAIQGKEDNFQVTDVIPIGVKFFELGKYTIDIPTREGLFETQKIYLKDKYRGNSIHDFTNGGYTFKAGPGEFKDRFEIIFKRRNISVSSQASLHTLADGKINIIKENDFISISSSNSLLKKVEIFNLSGRSIYQNQTINQTQLQIPAGIFGKEILIVNVETSEGEIVSKKLINN